MNFDTPLSRAGTHSEKYDLLVEKFGRSDILPLWVADMDLPVAPQIQEALLQRMRHPVYGYTRYDDIYFDAIGEWMLHAHGWQVERAWISPINAIVTALNLAVETLTQKGEGVLLQPPIYPPFYSAVKKGRRRVLENELVLKEGHYEIDFEDFEAKAKEAKLFLFCSPHNPTGRVWQAWELERIAAICQREGVIIVSDEVHADLVYSPNRHIPLGSIPAARDITVTLNAPSKTFNVAGIVTAYTVTANSSLRRRFTERFRRYALDAPSLISQVVTVAAYTASSAWLESLKNYLRENLAYLHRRLLTMPKIKPMPTEATFLLWLDCRQMGMAPEALKAWWIDEARLGLNPGDSFGSGGEGFMRLNFAVPQSMLKEAMDRLEEAYGRFERHEGRNN